MTDKPKLTDKAVISAIHDLLHKHDSYRLYVTLSAIADILAEGGYDVEKALTPEWTDDDSAAAETEGWNIFECSGSENGPWQIQRFDEVGEWEHELGRPYPFKEDAEVWSLLRDSPNPLHQRALAFLKEYNREEYDAITQSKGTA